MPEFLVYIMVFSPVMLLLFAANYITYKEKKEKRKQEIINKEFSLKDSSKDKD